MILLSSSSHLPLALEQAVMISDKIEKFDMTQLKYVNTEFQEAGDVLGDTDQSSVW